MIDARYSAKIQSVAHLDADGALSAKLAQKYKEMHDYFASRAGLPSGGRGCWNQDHFDKLANSINWHTDQAKKIAAGRVVQWPAGKSEHHDKIIGMTRKAINTTYAAVHSTFFRHDAAKAIGNMSNGAASRLAAKLNSVIFEASFNVLTKTSNISKEFIEKHGQAAGVANGRNIKVGPNPGTYAHECAHVIDYPIQGSYEKRQGAFSGHSDWLDGWRSEINTPESPLTEYAKENPCEGFAEFGRAMWHEGAASVLKEKFPKCFAFWVKNIEG